MKDFKKFIEEIIFQRNKDKRFRNAEEFKGTILKNFKNVDVSKIYVKIVNYQIKKYGQTLNGFDDYTTQKQKELRKKREDYASIK